MVNVLATITISAVNYTAYAFTSNAVTDADQYWAGRISGAAWAAATTMQKQTALIQAADWIDSLVWGGTKTVSSQAREFPRDTMMCRGTALTDGTIPDQVVKGEFHLALALIADSTAQSLPGTGTNVRRAKAGSAEVEFFRPTQGTAFDLPVPKTAYAFLGCLLASAAASAGEPVAYGTDECSQFTDRNRFGLSEGF